jgi:hypothetical protein
MMRLKNKGQLQGETVVERISYDLIFKYLGITAEEFSLMDVAEQQRTRYNAYRAKRRIPLISKEEWDSLLTASSGDFELANLNANRKDGGLPLEESDAITARFEAKVEAEAKFEAKVEAERERNAQVIRTNHAILSVVGTVALLIVVWVLRPAGARQDQTGDLGRDEIGAKVACEELIKRDLKAPSTASFSGADETQIEYLGGGTHTVRGWVHAQNRFGASIHSRYVCEITRTGDDRWQRETISLN